MEISAQRPDGSASVRKMLGAGRLKPLDLTKDSFARMGRTNKQREGREGDEALCWLVGEGEPERSKDSGEQLSLTGAKPSGSANKGTALW